MSAGDEESGVSDGQDEGCGSGSRGVVFGYSDGERVGQELEVEVLEVDEEVAEVVGKSLVDKVVEVDHLEHFSSQQEGIGTFENKNNHND